MITIDGFKRLRRLDETGMLDELFDQSNRYYLEGETRQRLIREYARRLGMTLEEADTYLDELINMSLLVDPSPKDEPNPFEDPHEYPRWLAWYYEPDARLDARWLNREPRPILLHGLAEPTDRS